MILYTVSFILPKNTYIFLKIFVRSSIFFSSQRPKSEIRPLTTRSLIYYSPLNTPTQLTHRMSIQPKSGPYNLLRVWNSYNSYDILQKEERISDGMEGYAFHSSVRVILTIMTPFTSLFLTISHPGFVSLCPLEREGNNE